MDMRKKAVQSTTNTLHGPGAICVCARSFCTRFTHVVSEFASMSSTFFPRTSHLCVARTTALLGMVHVMIMHCTPGILCVIQRKHQTCDILVSIVKCLQIVCAWYTERLRLLSSDTALERCRGELRCRARCILDVLLRPLHM